MLDEFALAQNPEPRRTSSTEAVAHGDKDPPTPEGAHVEDFAQQLQAQMAAFMGDMDDSPEMKRELEGMMKDLGAAVHPDASSMEKPMEKPEPKLGPKSSGSEEPFQATIRKTMERMQAFNTEAEAAAPADTSDDFLAQMLKNMPTSEALGGDDQEGFDKMLLGMMEQLTNKEILYEPMKELHDKFPPWMLKNATSIKPEDSSRYHEQQKLVNEIVGRFEQKSYSDSNPGDREFIVDRMQKVSWLETSMLATPRSKLSRCKLRAAHQLTWLATWTWPVRWGRWTLPVPNNSAEYSQQAESLRCVAYQRTFSQVFMLETGPFGGPIRALGLAGYVEVSLDPACL